MAGREGEATEVELVGFERPEGGGKTLYISGIPTSLSREEKWVSLASWRPGMTLYSLYCHAGCSPVRVLPPWSRV